MHPSLVNFSWYTAMDILGTHDLSTSFLQDVGLLPQKTLSPPCPKCGKGMGAHADHSRKMKWRFRCSKTPCCNGSINPLENTAFQHTHLSFSEVLAIIFEFVRETPVTHTIRRISEWRKYRGEKPIDNKTVIEFYSFCRNVCQIVSSHLSVEPLETVKAAESYYRVNRLPKSLSEGEMIDRFLKDMKSMFPGPCLKGLEETGSSPVQACADSNVNNRISSNSDKDKSHLHENVLNSAENTTDLSFSNKDKPFLDKNDVSSQAKKRDLYFLNGDESYPCGSLVNSSENPGDFVIIDDMLSPEQDIVYNPVKYSMTLLNEDTSCHKENINSPVSKKKCITTLLNEG